MIKLETKFRYSIEVTLDDAEIRGNAMCSGDEELDKEVEDSILERLDRGDIWAWACVRVTATTGGGDLVGEDYLGGCTYDSEEDFKAGGYYEDMCEVARKDLVDKLRRAYWTFDKLPCHLKRAYKTKEDLRASNRSCMMNCTKEQKENCNG